MALSGINIIIVLISIVAPIIYSGQTAFIIQKLNELFHWKLGCNPVPSVGNVSLHYFDKRGRAEAIRLLMEDQMISYTEKKFDESTWHEQRERGIAHGLYSFGQLPAIITSKRQYLVQSKVILQYLGRSVGLDCDCADISRCDMIAAGIEDLNQIRKQFFSTSEFQPSIRNEYFTSILPTWLQYFERLLVRDTADSYFHNAINYDGPYFASGRLTWLDYLVFDMIENNCNLLEHTVRLGKEGITLDNETVLEIPDTCFQLFERFPHLGVFSNHFRNRANLAAYVSSERRLPYSAPFSRKYG